LHCTFLLLTCEIPQRPCEIKWFEGLFFLKFHFWKSAMTSIAIPAMDIKKPAAESKTKGAGCDLKDFALAIGDRLRV
jgi:hypothetical protein